MGGAEGITAASTRTLVCGPLSTSCTPQKQLLHSRSLKTNQAPGSQGNN